MVGRSSAGHWNKRNSEILMLQFNSFQDGPVPGADKLADSDLQFDNRSSGNTYVQNFTVDRDT